MRLFCLFALFGFAVSQTLSCTGMTSGYYCTDESNWAWCYGSSTPITGTCTSGLVCACGYTDANPCTWPDTPPSLCTGSPGDFLGGTTTTSSSASATPSATTSSTATEEPAEQSSNSSITEPDEVDPPSERIASAYFTNWPQYHTGSLDGYSCTFVPSDIDASHLTHIFYAFAVFDESFEVQNYEWNDFDFYTELQAKKETYTHLKTLISIGGWNFNYYDSTKDLFSTMASTQENRQTFINSAITYAHTHGFDGIDIDWEYPGYTDQGGQPEDTENFTSLLREMRIAIENDTDSTKLLLSIAAPMGVEKIALIELEKIHKYLDFMNLMAYDLHGSWDSNVGPHTALYNGYDDICIDYAVQFYLDANVPTRKLILGLAAYGRTWELANTGEAASYGTAGNGAGSAGVCTQEEGFLSSFEVTYMIDNGAVAVEDESTDTFFAYNDDMFVTYDTVDTHATKIDYMCDNNFGGAFIWAMDLDTSYTMIDAMYDRVTSCTTSQSSSSSALPVSVSSSSSSAPISQLSSSSSSSVLPVSVSSSSSGSTDICAQCNEDFKSCVTVIESPEEICPCVAVLFSYFKCFFCRIGNHVSQMASV
jgi:chitinase